jgi:hypothetical protein
VRAAPLQVGRIVVTGNERLSSAEVQALTHGLYGRSILTADLTACRRRLLESPWVADAALRRVLPSTIEVRVVERQPIGISRLGNQLYLIDRSGTVIDEFGPRYREFDLPIVDGLVRTPKRGKPAIDAERAELAARVIDSVSTRKAIARRLSQIDVSDLHDVVALLEGDSALLHLGEERFVRAAAVALEVASALRGSSVGTSTTSTCGSTIAYTPNRAALRARSRQANRRLVDSGLDRPGGHGPDVENVTHRVRGFRLDARPTRF